MPPEDIYRHLASEYLQQLKHRDIPQEPACVIFSGVPGSGKTTLAKKLSQDLNAQYIRHDDIRELARSQGYDVERLTISSISRIVMDDIMERDANKRVIIDASLDRSWPLFFDYVSRYGATAVVIRLDVPRHIIEQRIARRSEGDFGRVTNIDEFYEQFEASKKHVPATLTLGVDYSYSEVLQRVKMLVS